MVKRGLINNLNGYKFRKHYFCEIVDYVDIYQCIYMYDFRECGDKFIYIR